MITIKLVGSFALDRLDVIATCLLCGKNSLPRGVKSQTGQVCLSAVFEEPLRRLPWLAPLPETTLALSEAELYDDNERRARATMVGRWRESCAVALHSLSSRAPHNGAAVWSAVRQGAGAQSK